MATSYKEIHFLASFQDTNSYLVLNTTEITAVYLLNIEQGMNISINTKNLYRNF